MGNTEILEHIQQYMKLTVIIQAFAVRMTNFIALNYHRAQALGHLPQGKFDWNRIVWMGNTEILEHIQQYIKLAVIIQASVVHMTILPP